MRKWDSETLDKLLIVQEVDLKIREQKFAISEHYRLSKEEDPILLQLKGDLVLLEQSIATTIAQYEMYTGTLDDIRTAIKGLATTKSGAPKPRTRSSTEALRIEEEKLTQMVEETDTQIRQLNAERTVVIGRIAQRANDVVQLQDGPEAKIRKINAKIKRLERQRAEYVKGMPTLLLRRYDRLRSSRSGIGLTILRDAICTVCRMKTPTAIRSRLNNSEQIPSCPACGRMVARVEFVNTPSPQEIEEQKAAAIKQAEEDRILAEKKAAEKKKAAERKKEAEKKKIVLEKKRAAAKKEAEKKKIALEKKRDAAKRAAEKKKIALEKKRDAAKKAAEKKKIALEKKRDAAKKVAEKKKIALEKKRDAAKKAAEKKKALKKIAKKKALVKKTAKKTPAKKAAKKVPAKKVAKKTAKKAPAKKAAKKTLKKTAKKKAPVKKAAKKTPAKKASKKAAQKTAKKAAKKAAKKTAKKAAKKAPAKKTPKKPAKKAPKKPAKKAPAKKPAKSPPKKSSKKK
jgi:predicted  nucleic acid-binding Zn-ribbon protein